MIMVVAWYVMRYPFERKARRSAHQRKPPGAWRALAAGDFGSPRSRPCAGHPTSQPDGRFSPIIRRIRSPWGWASRLPSVHW